MFRCLLLSAIGALSLANAQSIMAPDEGAIRGSLETVRMAALESEPEKAGQIFANDLVLISQSGKVYGREAALFDLGNGFEAWDNSEVAVRLSEGRAIVTYINARTRTGMSEARFRVMQVWEKREDAGWVIIAQSSVRLN
ncbi:nuclear transport factor 2 family protein [Altererythrobacter sp. JGD-16]|uniref:Nuclear transport factor 2 family protein n=2 Tax=Altererythrobacter lutimaris TaxID=2743979 RepID=A0A850HDY1_9SPHN|nr:nuclear transport factor 2 family protein [Altererythrobacter lutimaris]